MGSTKIMKQSTIAKKLSLLKISHSSIAYKIVADVVDAQNASSAYGKIIRPCHLSGCGRYATNLDYTTDICQLLDTLKIKYECGNDAPRGGLPGNFIKIKTHIQG